jgi:galactose-1-phosphate uridylyltransferase
MNDIDHVMDHVKDIWQRYAEGKVELIAASAAAHHAVLTIWRLLGDFAEESQWFGDGLQLIQW